MKDRKQKKQHHPKRKPRTDEDHPLVTISQYGPDDKTVTKIVAAVFRNRRDQSGKLKRWVGAGITESPTFRRELLELIKKTRPRKIALTTGVIGCVHEEGQDYPRGQACPFCPFWRGGDRWANAKPIILSLSALDKDQPWPG